MPSVVVVVVVDGVQYAMQPNANAAKSNRMAMLHQEQSTHKKDVRRTVVRPSSVDSPHAPHPPAKTMCGSYFLHVAIVAIHRAVM